MVGLTGFSSPPFSGTTIADDQRVFDDFLQPGVFDSANATQSGDYVFIIVLVQFHFQQANHEGFYSPSNRGRL